MIVSLLQQQDVVVSIVYIAAGLIALPYWKTKCENRKKERQKEKEIHAHIIQTLLFMCVRVIIIFSLLCIDQTFSFCWFSVSTD